MDIEEIREANKLLFEQRIDEAIVAYSKIIDSILKREDKKEILQKLPVDGLGNIDDQRGYYQFNRGSWYAQQLAQGKLEPNPFEGIALCFSYQSKYLQGKEWYKQRMRSNWDIYQLVYGLSNSYYNLKIIYKSVKLYKQAIQLNPRCDKGYQGLANCYFYVDSHRPQSRQQALKALEFNPTNIYAQIIQAFTESSYQSQLDKLYLILQRQPQLSAKLYHLIGVIQFRQGQVGKAYAMFRRSLEQQKYVSPAIALANLSLLNGSYSQAEAYARMSLEIEEYNPLGMATLGAALIYLQRQEQALEWLYGALEFDWEQIFANYYRGVANFYLGNWDGAFKGFISGRIGQEQKERKHLALAACSWSEKHYESVDRTLNQYSEKHPLDLLVNYHLGRLKFLSQQYKQALQFMTLALPKYDKEPTLLFMIGCCHLNLGADEEAFHFIEKSVELDETFLQGWLALGHFKINSADFAKATTYFETALKLDPDNSEAQFAISYLKHEKPFQTEELKNVAGQLENKSKQSDDRKQSDD